ncbi:hypothetical protein L3X38_039337 [Prunus dulcis]|uniref:ATPase AAA-type core domain-containing protein n=1 Tax=Prunus dulcis TaxID=3755 RepID=A0AAD4YSH1_PRUDU|nr:hypothetical protein L3X38_039337 [Prunus dulcis]
MVHATFTLSGLLNFMDGLWSSCGDERIIVFTTNHKDDDDDAALVRVVKVTPAEICEEALKKNDEDEDDDDDAALERVVDLLKLEGTNSIEKTEMQAEKRQENGSQK